ncbi:MAG: SH2 domain-containing protein [Chlamydiales bacterium]|nr:SH2 domain-containing protein [Chlamydiales bacterium]
MESITREPTITNSIPTLPQQNSLTSSSGVDIRPVLAISESQPMVRTVVALPQCGIPVAEACLVPAPIELHLTPACHSAFLGVRSTEETIVLLRNHPRGTYISYITEKTPRVFVTWKSRQGDDIKTLSFDNEKTLENHVSVLQPYSQELENDPGFHVGTTKEDSIELLSKAPQGSYLIRQSTSKPNGYCIDVVGESMITSTIMFRSGVNWKIDGFIGNLAGVKDKFDSCKPLSTLTYRGENIVGYKETQATKVSNVTALFIEDCVLSGPYVLDNFIKRFPDLTSLNMSGTSCTFDMNAFELLQERPAFKLILVNCRRIWNEITIEGIHTLYESFPNILPNTKGARP